MLFRSCVGGSVSLSVSGASTYSWSPSTGLNTTSGASVIANPTTTTSYTITGTGSNGCTSSSTQTVTIGEFPVILSTTATPSSICPGSTSHLLVITGGAPPTGYCVPSASTGCDNGNEYIANVTFEGINNSSTCGQTGANQYTDYTAVSTILAAGNTYPVTVSNGKSYSGDWCRVYCDWNQDGDFTDTGEETTLTGTASFTGNVSVPSTAKSGTTLMQIGRAHV